MITDRARDKGWRLPRLPFSFPKTYLWPLLCGKKPLPVGNNNREPSSDGNDRRMVIIGRSRGKGSQWGATGRDGANCDSPEKTLPGNLGYLMMIMKMLRLVMLPLMMIVVLTMTMMMMIKMRKIAKQL